MKWELAIENVATTIQAIADYVNDEDMKITVGRMAVEHYKENFDREGFLDESFVPCSL